MAMMLNTQKRNIYNPKLTQSVTTDKKNPVRKGPNGA